MPAPPQKVTLSQVPPLGENIWVNRNSVSKHDYSYIYFFFFFTWADFISNRDSTKSILIPKVTKITQPFSFSISKKTERKSTLYSDYRH